MEMEVALQSYMHGPDARDCHADITSHTTFPWLHMFSEYSWISTIHLVWWIYCFYCEWSKIFMVVKRLHLSLPLCIYYLAFLITDIQNSKRNSFFTKIKTLNIILKVVAGRVTKCKIINISYVISLWFWWTLFYNPCLMLVIKGVRHLKRE